MLCAFVLNAQVFISEIHYDNTGADVGEGVEITGPAGTDLTGWYIQPYNGSGGVTYTPIGSFSGTIPDEGAGFGSVFVAISGLQNGTPDGVALINDLGVSVEFISYEGSFAATNGPANGQNATDIGTESSTSAVGGSLSLTDGGWVATATNSFGLINPGLTVGAPSGPTMSVTPNSYTGLDYVFGAGPSVSQSGVVSSSGLTGNVTGTAITNFEFSVDNVTFSAFPSPIPGVVLNIAPQTFYVRLVAGLAVGTYTETLTLQSAGAPDLDITFSGTVSAAPCVQSLQALPYNGINGTASFSHTSSNLPPAGPAELCGNNFLLSYQSTPATDASTNEFGNQSTTGLSGLSSEDFGGEASFQTYPIDVSGVNAVTVDAVGATNGTNVFNGASEQFEWWYTLDGGAQVPFFTTTSDGSLAASILSLDVTGVNELVVGFTFNLNGGNTGFQNVDLTVVEYNPLAPTVTIGSTVMNGFSYLEGAGPSASQVNTLEWANLTGSVSSTNPVNYFEFSTNGGSSWNAATALNVPIPPFPANSPFVVNVDVRLIAGLSTGNYRDTVVLSSPGAPTIEVYLEGDVFPAPVVINPCTELFFSEYIEGSSNNKCLEIYNPTAMDIDLALANYQIALYGNGSPTATTGPVALSGIVPAYGTYVICNAGVDPGFAAVADVVGGALNTVTFYNGNDVVALLKAGQEIDVIGQIGNDPGVNGWSNAGVQTTNRTLVRIATVLAGDNAGLDTFDPSLEWLALPTDDFSDLGQHSNDCAPFVWTGLIDFDWANAGNWNKNAVPTSADVIIIPSTPIGISFPLTSFDITVNDLTVETGANLTIGAGFGLTVINQVQNNGNLVLSSGSTGTAWLDDFTNPTASYLGNITVQTYVSTGSGLGQRFFGSPVVSGAIQGLDNTYTGYPLGAIIPTATCDPNQLDANSPYSNLFEWNEAAAFPTGCEQEGWVAISASSNFVPGRGYSAWVNDASIVSFTGTPNSGDVSFVTTGVSGSGVPNADGWHLLANPFPSPLDVASVINSGFTSPQIYDGGSGPFSGTYLPALVSGNSLAVMQAFVAESTTGSTFTAAQADRIAANASWLRPSFAHMLEIMVEGNSFADKTYLYFDFAATNAFDPYGDTKKRDSDYGQPTLYTSSNGEQLSLNGLALDNMNTVVPMGLKPGANGSFTLSFDGLASFPNSSLIFLEDKLSGEWINLRENNSYTFDASTTDLQDRFNLHFTAPIELTTSEASCEGGDASISIDFGNHQVNGLPLKWNYALSSNNVLIEELSELEGVQIIENLEEGVYVLSLSHNNYSFEMNVLVEGAQRVEAELDVPTIVDLGSSLELNAVVSGADLFTWTIANDVVSSSTPTLTYTFNTPGLVLVELLASNEDCHSALAKEIEVVNKTTALNERSPLDAVLVYGKSGKIWVDLNGLELDGDTKVEVYNLLGQVFYSANKVKAPLQIETSGTTSYYFVSISNGNLAKTFKVFIK